MTLHLSVKGRLTPKLLLSLFDIKRLSLPFVIVAVMLSCACAVEERQSGIPAGAQETVNTFTEDFNNGRFEKIYREAADEWRAQVSLEQSNETFRTLKERLGNIRQERTYMSGRQQQTAGARLPANSLVLRYNAKFRRADGSEADGMETFTLIDRDGRYQMAGYSVSSNLLQ